MDANTSMCALPLSRTRENERDTQHVRSGMCDVIPSYRVITVNPCEVKAQKRPGMFRASVKHIVQSTCHKWSDVPHSLRLRNKKDLALRMWGLACHELVRSVDSAGNFTCTRYFRPQKRVHLYRNKHQCHDTGVSPPRKQKHSEEGAHCHEKAQVGFPTLLRTIFSARLHIGDTGRSRAPGQDRAVLCPALLRLPLQCTIHRQTNFSRSDEVSRRGEASPKLSAAVAPAIGLAQRWERQALASVGREGLHEGDAAHSKSKSVSYADAAEPYYERTIE